MATGKKQKATQATLERRAEIWRMRMTGVTYEQIGKALGITRQAVHAHIQATLEQLNEERLDNAQQYRDAELARLDDQVRMVYSSLPSSKEGRWIENEHLLKAVDRLLKISERRARLLGLDLQKTELAGNVGVTWSQFIGLSEDDGIADNADAAL